MSVMVPTTDELKALWVRVKELEDRLNQLETNALVIKPQQPSAAPARLRSHTRKTSTSV
jgi:BMFP domain-containing protein YqiC